jgi:hypothetical protein
VKSLILKGVIHNARQRYDKAIEKFDLALRHAAAERTCHLAIAALRAETRVSLATRSPTLTARSTFSAPTCRFSSSAPSVIAFCSSIMLLSPTTIWPSVCLPTTPSCSISARASTCASTTTNRASPISSTRSRSSRTTSPIAPPSSRPRPRSTSPRSALSPRFDLSVVQQLVQHSSQRRGSASASSRSVEAPILRSPLRTLSSLSSRRARAPRSTRRLAPCSYAKRVELPSPRHELAGGHHHGWSHRGRRCRLESSSSSEELCRRADRASRAARRHRNALVRAQRRVAPRRKHSDARAGRRRL